MDRLDGMYGGDDNPTDIIPGFGPRVSTPAIPPDERDPWWRANSGFSVVASALAVVVVVLIGYVVLRTNNNSTAADPNPTPDATPSLMASDSASPAASPSPSPSPAETTTTAAPVTTHTVPTAPPAAPPPSAEQAPDPQPTPAASGCPPTFDGANAAPAQVRTALAAAGAKHYYQGVQKPPGYTGDGTDVAVPVKLMNAVSYMESGWQSAIHSCDGGLGLMQMMAPTITWLNQRFGANYSIPLDLQENADAGANYLEYLIMYYGLYYFGGNFDIYAQAPVGPNGMMLELRDPVIAAYNVGVKELEDTSDPENVLSIPNWDYVNAVEKFMNACPCDAM